MNRPAAIARSVAFDLRARLRRTTAAGSQSHGVALQAAVDYAVSSAKTLLSRGGVSDVTDCRVLELGPGDNVGFALCLIAFGAQSVTAIDRFTVRSDPTRQRMIYRALLERFDGVEAERLRGVVAPDGTLRPGRVELVSGLAIEDAAARFGVGAFDLIASVAVCEHLRDVPESFGAMHTLLARGGIQLHQVDLRDHGLFTSRGMGPLEWLTSSERTHRLMVRNSGGPNRVLLPDYRELFATLGCEHRIDVASVAGADTGLAPYPATLRFGEHYGHPEREMVTQVRGRLARRFRGWDEPDLLSAGIFLAARKL